jgi:nicotinamide-nucleotide adenylyltransferase
MEIRASKRTVNRLKQIQSLLDQLNPDAAPQALIVPGSPVPQGTIIVFPGSFNPPTNAHLALMSQARQYVRSHMLSADEKNSPVRLYAAMSRHIVDKEAVQRPSLLDRIMLLNNVLRHHLRHTGIMLLNRGLYVEQAQAIRTYFPKVKKLYFLIGFDKIVQILDPHYYEDRDTALRKLFALAELLVAPRGNAGQKELNDLLNKPENSQFARYIHPLPFGAAYRDFSSTRIRQHPEAHLQDVPQEVRRFIRETHAYDQPERMPDGSQVDYYGERMKALDRLVHSS